MTVIDWYFVHCFFSPNFNFSLTCSNISDSSNYRFTHCIIGYSVNNIFQTIILLSKILSRAMYLVGKKKKRMSEWANKQKKEW